MTRYPRGFAAQILSLDDPARRPPAGWRRAYTRIRWFAMRAGVPGWDLYSLARRK